MHPSHPETRQVWRERWTFRLFGVKSNRLVSDGLVEKTQSPISAGRVVSSHTWTSKKRNTSDRRLLFFETTQKNSQVAFFCDQHTLQIKNVPAELVVSEIIADHRRLFFVRRPTLPPTTMTTSSPMMPTSRARRNRPKHRRCARYAKKSGNPSVYPRHAILAPRRCKGLK